jgi:hypothetical protein
MNHIKSKTETVVLRSQNPRNDVLSSFSNSPKETRITSYLGYLLSLDINAIINYFGIQHAIQNVLLERTLSTQRCDIIVQTIKVDYIIEAKINNQNPESQVLLQAQEYQNHYPGRNVKMLIITPDRITVKDSRVTAFSWKKLSSCIRNNMPKALKPKILCEEFMNHLENTGIVPRTNIKEVYARDVNREPQSSLFIKGNVYYCNYNENISQCNYFAPYFGRKISEILPGVREGLYYVSFIYDHIGIYSYEDLVKEIKIHVRKRKLKKQFPNLDECLRDIRKTDEKYDETKPLMLLLLNKPHLVFNPAIPKGNLQKGSGWLSKNYYSFEELFSSTGF